MNDKLEIDGLSVDELINRAVAPSDERLRDYRSECVAKLRKE